MFAESQHPLKNQYLYSTASLMCYTPSCRDTSPSLHSLQEQRRSLRQQIFFFPGPIYKRLKNPKKVKEQNNKRDNLATGYLKASLNCCRLPASLTSCPVPELVGSCQLRPQPLCCGDSGTLPAWPCLHPWSHRSVITTAFPRTSLHVLQGNSTAETKSYRLDRGFFSFCAVAHFPSI